MGIHTDPHSSSVQGVYMKARPVDCYCMPEFKQQFLYFLSDPRGQLSFRPRFFGLSEVLIRFSETLSRI